MHENGEDKLLINDVFEEENLEEIAPFCHDENPPLIKNIKKYNKQNFATYKNKCCIKQLHAFYHMR